LQTMACRELSLTWTILPWQGELKKNMTEMLRVFRNSSGNCGSASE